jgi:hypothetical protein
VALARAPRCNALTIHRNLADWIGKPEDEAVGVGTRKTPWPGLVIKWGTRGSQLAGS